MHPRSCLPILTALVVIARRTPAQATSAGTSPLGVWRGTSLCLVKPSPCNDETVVYRITRVKRSDSLAVDARKIVNGHEEEMGVLRCAVGTRDETLTCTIPRAVWRFTIRGDSLVGELRLSDNTKFRDVRTARSRH